MKALNVFKSILKALYLLLKIFLIAALILILMITSIVIQRRNSRVSSFKSLYPKAFQLIEEKYDGQIYLSDHLYNSYIIIEFKVKKGFENTYNTDDLPKQEFYSLVGHEIFNCFKQEITNELEYDKVNGTNYFRFPVCIEIKYEKSSDGYASFEFFEKDWSE